MQHFAALLLIITLSVCSVHCFLVANEGNEKCKEVRRETRTNNALFVVVPAISCCGCAYSLRLFLRFRDVGDIREARDSQ